MKLTRRELTRALACGTAGLVQAAGAQQEDSEQLRKAASERIQRNSEMLAKHPVPISAEPAFTFHP